MSLNFKPTINRLKPFFLFGTLLSLCQCIEPFTPDANQQDTQLVVNGIITDEPGPHTVTLTQTKAVPYEPGAIPYVRNAFVVVSDNKGNQEYLAETAPGIYKTSANFLGQVGNSYTLTITIGENEYVSAPEVLQAVPAIDDVTYDVEKRVVLDQDKQPVSINYLNAYVDTRDPAAERNFYRWEYEVIYEVETQPWDYCIPNPLGVECIPAPKSCCKTCWVTHYNDVIRQQNDRLVNGKEIKKQLVAKLPIENPMFSTRLQLEIRQYSLSEPAYSFYNTLQTQVTGVGNIQDPPPAFIKGNMTHVNKPDDVVLGNFSASGIARKSIFIDPMTLGLPVKFFVYPDDCREMPNSTTITPAGW